MSESVGRSPLDRLLPVHDIPAPADDETADDVTFGDPAGLGDGPRWGIGAMPSWLDPDALAEQQPQQRFDSDGNSNPADDDDNPGGIKRFAVAPPAAIALIAVGVIACVIAGFGLFTESDDTPAVDFMTTAGPTTGAAAPSAPAAPQSTAAQIVVSVVGLVHRPGLVRLAPGARVADALAAAGEPRAGADVLSLNLAQPVRDGDQILVGYGGGPGQIAVRSAVIPADGSSRSPGASVDPSGGSSTAPGVARGADQPDADRVDLNTATEADLDALPGVGPVTAKAIIAWRTSHGRFASVDQLGEVDGIGPGKLAKLRDRVTV
ncbi:ComEA family DNA-binding protein [Gordonia sp. ABSL1-1]|uniref:ComEA family DNA-binding protein n=1 Tax=Gordonia sp. ABSL1-1 TaxID=3053923 RepID=UPI0025725880|nr:ComEA family DNA-binding protein [Gordonia sp. ABSL1-1]MDL9935549.1 ComEA family DNA-binding protein [Gordonia sp. ABSL1-1]